MNEAKNELATPTCSVGIVSTRVVASGSGGSRVSSGPWRCNTSLVNFSIPFPLYYFTIAYVWNGGNCAVSNQILEGGQVGKTSLICLEGKSMTPSNDVSMICCLHGKYQSFCPCSIKWRNEIAMLIQTGELTVGVLPCRPARGRLRVGVHAFLSWLGGGVTHTPPMDTFHDLFFIRETTKIFSWYRRTAAAFFSSAKNENNAVTNKVPPSTPSVWKYSRVFLGGF